MGCLDSVVLVITVNHSLDVEAMLVVKNLQQIYSSTKIFLSFKSLSHNTLKASHISHNLELQSFPIQKPSKLCYPFLSLKSTSSLQNLNIMPLKDCFDFFYVIIRLVINPQNNIFLESDGCRKFNNVNFIVELPRNDLFDEKGSEGSKQNFLLFGEHRKLLNFFAIQRGGVEECSLSVLKLIFYDTFMFECESKVLQIEGLMFLEEAAEFEISDSKIALVTVVRQQLHIDL